MNDLRQAAQQALEALEEARAAMQFGGVYDKAITALRAALAEPEQPVALRCCPPGKCAYRQLHPKENCPRDLP